MDADVLAQVLRGLPPIDDPNVLVGTSTADDAGVYRVNEALALVQTVDFFTPIVDDPYTFGAIAAANALSDVYAMGGTPVTALAIVGFPEDQDPAILHEILRGGAEKAREAGIHVIGGHTVKDAEPKYGLSVTGLIHPERIILNSSAQAGDILFLTKAIGTGILTTARRRDAIDDAAMAEAIVSMSALNRAGAEAMVGCDVHAATDVTGFGLIGHLREMLDGAGVGADIDADTIPFFQGVLALARDGVVPGGTRTNLRQALANGVAFDDRIDESLRLALCDAQTSGGLLVAVASEHAERYAARARELGVAIVARIGITTATTGLRVHA